MSNHNLFTLGADGGVEPATSEQILAAAHRVLAHRVRRGATLESPQKVREYLSMRLGHLDYEIFGLILLDNRLPDATGGEILQELGSTSATAAIPVVVFSSDTEELLDQLLANGAAESVPKPFDIHQFMAIIDRYLPDDPDIR